MESIGRMVAIILAILLLFLFPLRYDALLQKETVESYVSQELEYFFHQISQRHYLDIAMYDQFMMALQASNDSYVLELFCYENVVYANDLSTELILEDMIHKLKSELTVTFHAGDYVVLKLRKRSDSFYDRLSNLFLPMYQNNKEFIMGGRIP